MTMILLEWEESERKRFVRGSRKWTAVARNEGMSWAGNLISAVGSGAEEWGKGGWQSHGNGGC